MPRRTTGGRARGWIARFWHGEAGLPGALAGIALVPLEGAFRGAIAGRSALFEAGILRTEIPPVPVISVGNLTVGGTGKTPVTAWLARLLVGWGRSPGVVLRGYGADEIAVHRDLNPSVPVFTARRRIEAVEAAAGGGCDSVLLDDGFQHRRLGRDLDVVLIAAERWIPPRRLLPRGPWREPLRSLERAGFVLVTRKSASREEAERVVADLSTLQYVRSVGIGYLAPTELIPLSAGGIRGQALGSLRGQAVLAVSSLADPAPFVAHLRGAGADTELLAFPDHHEFTAMDVEAIHQAAGKRRVVVTRKEAVKLRRWPRLPDIHVLEQELRMERGQAELEEALRGALDRSR